ncbi:ester cyclase [Actinomadura formosensis]|uniref:ester cyclase n=1 Tax=Actinomadura formosensis TaxID=60706 RepID=UPI00082D7234|nr:ester cyclase [Actinomadura formosensis]
MQTLDALYRRWLFQVWNGDYAVAEEILAPGFTGHWPDLQVHGPAGAIEQVRRSREYFGDVSTTLDVGPVVGDGMVAAGWSFHGSYRGGIAGATAAPGTRVSFSGHDIFRAEGGRFTEYWVVSDALGLMTALGAVGRPAPHTGPGRVRRGR